MTILRVKHVEWIDGADVVITIDVEGSYTRPGQSFELIIPEKEFGKLNPAIGSEFILKRKERTGDL